MSTTIDIACRTCKTRLWVGQGHYLYTSSEATMQRLRNFLREHIYHECILVADPSELYEQYECFSYEKVDGYYDIDK